MKQTGIHHEQDLQKQGPVLWVPTREACWEGGYSTGDGHETTPRCCDFYLAKIIVAAIVWMLDPPKAHELKS